MAKQLYDYWFVQFDFPDENGRPYKSSGGKMIWNEKLKREIPISWEIKLIDDIAEIYNGATPSTMNELNYGGDIVWITPKDLSDQKQKFIYQGERNISQVGYDSCSTHLLPSNSILMSSRAPIGLLAIAKIELCTNQGFKNFVPKSGNTSIYLYYYLQYHIRQIEQLGTGTTFKAITQNVIKNIEVPVPSLDEQERIVSKIEELFSKLDASVAELKTAKEKLKVYRQAVLKEAFDSVRSDCITTTIKSVCETIKVGIVIKPTQYYVKTDGVFAFRNANVRRNYIEDNDWAMISQEGHQKNLKSQVHTDDVLIARSGVNLGMAAAVPEKYDGYNAIDIVIAVPKKNFVLPKYLAQYTNSPYGVEIVKKNQHGAAQGHLNVKEYGNLPIFLPNISVQNELLQKIESRLSVCDSIEQTIDTSLQQAEALRQSILKQAFEGRLIE